MAALAQCRGRRCFLSSSGVRLEGTARIRGEESPGALPVSRVSIFSLHVSSLKLIDENILES